MLAMRTSDKILLAIDSLPVAYGVTIQEYLEAHREETWLSRNLPMLNEFLNGLASTHAKLDRLERSGLVWTEPSGETFPERGGRPRLYYKLTLAGDMRVIKLRD